MSSSLALSGDMSPINLSPIDIAASGGSPVAGFDVQGFVMKNILILLVSHFMSRWLAENYPARGYMFYLTMTSTLLSILLW